MSGIGKAIESFLDDSKKVISGLGDVDDIARYLSDEDFDDEDFDDEDFDDEEEEKE